jgi:transposase
MVAHVLAGKYAWHLPLYRQAQMLESQGIAIDRSTLAFWVGYAAAELAPLVSRLREILLGSAKLAVDETPAPVLDPGRGRTKTGYFWAMARDDRPWGGTDPPAVVCSYAPGRGAEQGLKPLAGYAGIVQCDGYAAYRQLADPARAGGPVTLAFRWAHVRRRFYDIARPGTDRHRGAAAHRRALRCRGQDSRPQPRSAPIRPPGREPAARDPRDLCVYRRVFRISWNRSATAWRSQAVAVGQPPTPLDRLGISKLTVSTWSLTKCDL